MSEVHLLDWLKGGSGASDGASNEVAEVVLAQPELFPDLLDGLRSPDKVVRGRAADALEKVSRVHTHLAIEHLDTLLDFAKDETLIAANMHLAMIFGHAACDPATVEKTLPVLLRMLDDPSVFARSWVIASLTIIARLYPERLDAVMQPISAMANDESIALRTRVRYALGALTDPDSPFPATWVKSEELKKRIYG